MSLTSQHYVRLQNHVAYNTTQTIFRLKKAPKGHSVAEWLGSAVQSIAEHHLRGRTDVVAVSYAICDATSGSTTMTCQVETENVLANSLLLAYMASSFTALDNTRPKKNALVFEIKMLIKKV